MIIKKAEYVISGTNASHIPNLNIPEFVFLGRSNVGKSSLLNAITNRKNLAYTSSKPGKTITLNFYNVNDQLLLVDVPGYGYAQRLVNDRLNYGKMIEDYLKKSQYLKLCFLVIDSRHEPTDDDLLMFNYLKSYEYQVVVIATKIDKISKNELNKNINVIRKKLEMNSNELLFPISSEKKIGIEKIHQLMETYL